MADLHRECAVYTNQGIKGHTGMETFANEPELAKLFREQKSTLHVVQKKNTGFCLMPVMANLLRLHFNIYNNACTLEACE